MGVGWGEEGGGGGGGVGFEIAEWESVIHA